MDLFLRKVIHPQARDNYRVILKDDGLEIEVGSIGVQFDGWHWGIDNLVPMSEADGEGSGKDRKHCMESFPERQGGEFASASKRQFSIDPMSARTTGGQHEACNFIKGESGRIVLVVPIASKPRAIVRAVQPGVGGRELYKMQTVTRLI